MEILNLGGAGEENIPPRLKSRRNKKLKIAVGIGSLAAVTGIGSTLAASISLNGGNAVEFGQGVATTAACNGTDSITLTPTSKYIPTSESFRLDTIKLSGINTATPDAYTGIGCAGKTLIIRAYTDDSDYSSFAVGGETANPLYFANYGGYFYNDGIAITLDGSGNVASLWGSRVNDTDGSGRVSFDYNNYSGSGIIEVLLPQNNFDDRGLDSRAVSKFTIESIDTPAGGMNTRDWYNQD